MVHYNKLHKMYCINFLDNVRNFQRQLQTNH